MGKDVLSKIRANDVYKALVRVLEDYGVDSHRVVDKRPHPCFVIHYCGLEREFEFPGTPRGGGNVKAYAASLCRFLDCMEREGTWGAANEDEVETHDMSQSTLPFEAERNPIVNIIDGEAMADSRDVAAYFGRQHKHVLEAYRNLSCSDHFRRSNFRPFKNSDLTGEYTSHVMMTKDGFAFMVLGFTGSKAAAFKEAYIMQFNAMEAELRRIPVAPSFDLNDPAWLRGQLLSYTEKVLALEETVATQQPKVEALERIAEADGSLCITDAAKTLQVIPNVLFKWLDRNGWTYSRVGSSERRAYQTKLNAGYLEHKVKTGPRDDGTEWVSTQVRVTPKGLAFLAEVFPPTARVA